MKMRCVLPNTVETGLWKPGHGVSIVYSMDCWVKIKVMKSRVMLTVLDWQEKSKGIHKMISLS